eukprot:gnl/MRDRNA2_/MRDRNA2_66205_c0_seq1.p1 gnl/MRDRNA2_/MRDRNA2_66205_c0~~gnl/MRDRNA2_/MRDRNA2_66205_c0_seq1.p1  ORF type:complete len:561 (+),score=78.39 gnl/MRDRNA2_/MRDRNA2_66205_c0_seq1:48-1685(+)
MTDKLVDLLAIRMLKAFTKVHYPMTGAVEASVDVPDDATCNKARRCSPSSRLKPTVKLLEIPSTSLPSSCDPREYGAKADGVSVDTDAINKAIQACPNGQVVLSGGIFVSGTVKLRSDLKLIIESNATLRAAKRGGHHFLKPDKNPYDRYQDYGHSHWKDSLLYANGLKNVTITGKGVIDGAGELSLGPPANPQPKPGDACKMFGIVSSENITISSITMKAGGWFTLLATNVTGLVIESVEVQPDRDGFDIIGCRHVRVNNVHIHGGIDDAVVLKSDFSIGAELESYDIVVSNSIIGSKTCNALNFGSETVGAFHDIFWENLTVTSAGKAGIGILSMDGSRIHSVTYRNIVMKSIATPFYFFIGARMNRPGGIQDHPPGSISNIRLENISCTDIQGNEGKQVGNWTGTLDGQPLDVTYNVTSVHPIGPNISFKDVSLVYKGGGLSHDVEIEPPHLATAYQPRCLGTRPAYGGFFRNVIGVNFDGVKISSQMPDGRPAFLLENVRDVHFYNSEAERSVGLNYDIGVRASSVSEVTVDAADLVVKAL